MKKLLLFVFGLAGSLFLAAPAQAQENAYQAGDNHLNIGISLGGYRYGYIGTRSTGMIPLSVSFERGINDKFSVGAYGGYASWNYGTAGYKYGWSYTSVGARGSFHYLPWLNDNLDLGLDQQKIDLYVSLLVGLEFQRPTGEWSGLGFERQTEFFAGPVLGFRYMFNPKLGGFFEAGRGALGYGTFGLTVRL
jgi:hypothetical protein